MVPAAKFPDASRSTSVLGVLVAVPVVALLATLPAVRIVASFVSAMAALALISAFTMLRSAICVLPTVPAVMLPPLRLVNAEPLPLNVPLTVPVNVGEASGARRAMLPFSLLMAVRMESLADTVPAPEAKPVMSLPVTMVLAMDVAPCVPVTSPARLPLKLVALPVRLPVKVPDVVPPKVRPDASFADVMLPSVTLSAWAALMAYGDATSR